MSSRLLCLVILVVVACKSKSSQQKPPDEAPPPSRDAAPTVTAPTSPPDPDALVMRVDGIGPLAKTTKVDESTIAAMFPDHDVKAVTISHGEELQETYIGISKAGTLLLKVVEPGATLKAVEVVSPTVANPFGVTIGATYADVVKVLGPLDCEDAGDDTDWRANFVVCTAAKVATHSFDFAHADPDIFSAKEMLADPAKLAKAKLVAIRWEAAW